MAKKASRSKKSRLVSHPKTKSLGQHAFTYLFSLFVAILVFFGESYVLNSQPPCANSHSCKTDLTESIQNGSFGIFNGQKVTPPYISLSQADKDHAVLGANTVSGDKHIYVDLVTQQLYAYQGNTLVLQTWISSGKWNKTPVGNFNIWEKLRSTRMRGGEGTDYYDLPNVPYVMYFYQDFGLHGAYWHDNFGHMMSHGCVNLRQVDAQTLYYWADGPSNGQLGTAVSVCNTFEAPNNCQQINPIN